MDGACPNRHLCGPTRRQSQTAPLLHNPPSLALTTHATPTATHAAAAKQHITRSARTLASALSLLLRDTRMRSFSGKLSIPLLHTASFSAWSTRTSLVFIIFFANFLISSIARGALRLHLREWSLLYRLTV